MRLRERFRFKGKKKIKVSILDGLNFHVSELSKWKYQKLSKNILAVATHGEVYGWYFRERENPKLMTEGKTEKRVRMIREFESLRGKSCHEILRRVAEEARGHLKRKRPPRPGWFSVRGGQLYQTSLTLTDCI